MFPDGVHFMLFCWRGVHDFVELRAVCDIFCSSQSTQTDSQYSVPHLNRYYLQLFTVGTSVALCVLKVLHG